MWGEMREWLKTASVPGDRYLRADFIAPLTKYDSKGAMFLESKKDMKKRGLASPDAADAIAVTFAFPVSRIDVPDRVDRERRSSYAGGSMSTSWMGS
jgi:hypothetical protein